MKLHSRIVQSIQLAAFLMMMMLTVFQFSAQRVFAQTEATPIQVELPDSSQAFTTKDPTIPLEHLRFLVKPLTAEELVVETNAWQDILKKELFKVAEKRIAMKKIRERDERKEEALQQDGEHDSSEENGMLSELEEVLPKLLDAKKATIERLSIVLDELELKGGEVESYRLYVNAQSGVSVDISDGEETWTLVKGWVKSTGGGQRWVWNFCKFFMILFVSYFGASIVARIIRHAVSRIKGVSQLLISFSGVFAKQTLFVIGMIVALTALEIDITPLLAAVGAAGFVIGFALQDTLSNFASGIMILGYRPFDVGDVVEAAGISGIVDSVTLFSTHIRTFDNKFMIVPNNKVWGGTITNSTASKTRRVDMTFEIGPNDDVGKAVDLLDKIVHQHELILDDPSPIIRMHNTTESSITIICRPWTHTANYWSVYWDMTRMVREEFEKNGILLPVPRRFVQIQQSEGTQPLH